MLMVGSNQNFQWRYYTLVEEVSGIKLNTKNYLVKQLIKNLPMSAQGLAEPHSGLCAAHVNSNTHKEISVISQIRGRGY